ncbi:1-acyl-sn-glycerol-3-phosphate acyltransferase [Paenalkalicoccus suaedae]|uniref:1-acyl-sn-glycerol-3-phosphate acyltransferase n=1 Tax=Paenalkalicoccus suaedae TaxID=2592382 RepID=A0A859FDT4_9BACI|nr:lysophospholipid acyltransferase family protein [Paenalkalicoccus suaedae]QKS71011.1 1-acyl-sn-glycerol-3-phosphate acyltransferase [Paenalkalicoccus suaedae]
MIEATKSRSFTKIFHVYNTWLLKRSFHRLHLSTRSVRTDHQGAIYIINHSSWWDPLVLFYLNEAILHTDALAMMDQHGLTRFPFFKKIGAFSIDSSSKRDIMKSLSYAQRQLEEGKHVFIFPQGNEYPLEKRPLQFFAGVAHLKQALPNVPIIPITFYHTHLHHQLPEWFIQIGYPIELDVTKPRKQVTADIEQALTKELDLLKEDVINEAPTFAPLLSGKLGIGATLEKMKSTLRRRN